MLSKIQPTSALQTKPVSYPRTERPRIGTKRVTPVGSTSSQAVVVAAQARPPFGGRAPGVPATRLITTAQAVDNGPFLIDHNSIAASETMIRPATTWV